MKRIIYFDCYMGISGDMTLGACIDLGVDAEDLKRELAGLGIGGYHIEAKKTVKHGFTGTDVDVILDEDVHGHEHTDPEQARLPDSEPRVSGHGTGHAKPSHGHDHRTLKSIREIIRNSTLKENVKETALNIFQVIAEAEAKVHGKDVEDVAFHEIGAVDSIVDICGAAVCFDLLGVEAVYCSPLREGSGTILCRHGELPVPVPAVMQMLPGSGIEMEQTAEIKTELVTPTGLGILKGTRAVCGPMPRMHVEQSGVGFGKRDTGRLNGLRAVLGTISGDRHDHQHPNAKAVSNRLAKSIGHLDAVKRMVDRGEDCSAVLTQLAAVRSEILGAGRVLLTDHISHCIVDAVQDGDYNKIEELNEAIRKFVK